MIARINKPRTRESGGPIAFDIAAGIAMIPPSQRRAALVHNAEDERKL